MGPVLGAALFFTLKSLGWGNDASWTAAVSAVCAVWWVFEPVPIPVTSLLPFALFPVLGVLSPREISESYGAPLILLLLRGFILSTAMAMNIEPALLMVSAAMSASCAFMLPVATAPNVVVFSTGAFPTKVVAREGLALNFIGALIITAVCAIML